MFKVTLFSVLLSFSLLFQACSDNSKSQEAQDANSMLSSNEFILTALDKKQIVVKKTPSGVQVEGMDGKVVIFDIFATWCPPCQQGATHLTSLQEKYKDDLVIIGVTIEEGIDNAKLTAFQSQYNAHYTLVNSTQNRRFVNYIASSLKLGARFPIPIVAMYKDGKLINHYIGAIEEEFIQSDIKKALEKH